MEKSVSLKSYPHFFKKILTSIFKFSTENFVDEISYFFQKTFPQCLFVRH
ncbi:hypothetical protein EY696_12240 [Enterococcus faecalis]|nr:hypothetical protein [Enterococcus faecalis]MBO6410119.1 hypothetical protein [Enterococcus faecalis]